MEVRVLGSYRDTETGWTYRQEELSNSDIPGTQSIEVCSVYNKDMQYIGNPEVARHLLSLGIEPELRSPDLTVCTVGFSRRDEKWYGWSHRGIRGFEVGDYVDDASHPCAANSSVVDVMLPVGFLAQTLEECKQMAIAYAQSVS